MEEARLCPVSADGMLFRRSHAVQAFAIFFFVSIAPGTSHHRSQDLQRSSPPAACDTMPEDRPLRHKQSTANTPMATTSLKASSSTVPERPVRSYNCPYCSFETSMFWNFNFILFINVPNISAEMCAEVHCLVKCLCKPHVRFANSGTCR